MATQTTISYKKPTKSRRRNKPYPLNGRKKLGPKSSWQGMNKKSRGQG